MKKYVIIYLPFLIIGMFNFNQVFSQKVFPEYSEQPSWSVLRCFWTNCSTEKFSYEKDTIMCNHNYSVILINESPKYIRVDSLKVLLLDSASCLSKEYVMYDFSRKIGDTIYIAYNLQNTPHMDTIPMLISNIDTIEQFTIKHKRFEIKFGLQGGTDLFRQMYWIEGIGSDIHPFFPYFYNNDASETSFQLLCCYQGNNQIFKNPVFQSCDTTITSLKSINDNNEVLISPNPCTNFFTIKFQNDMDVALQLFDSLGKLLISEKFKGHQKDISISKYPGCLYFLKILSENKLFCYKIIKTDKL